MTAHEKNKSIWLGIIFLVAGAALLLDNLNIFNIELPHYITSWKTLLIVIGLFLIFVRNKTTPGLVLIAVGVTNILWHDTNLFDNLHLNLWQLLIPILLMVAGASLIFRKSFDYETLFEEKKSDLDSVNEFVMFGGGKKAISSQNFRGGNVTVVFGGSELNFNQADLKPGINVINFMVLFGGCEIKVPADWTIQNEATAIFGAFEDARGSSLQIVPNPDKVLVIRGIILFGGGEVKLS